MFHGEKKKTKNEKEKTMGQPLMGSTNEIRNKEKNQRENNEQQRHFIKITFGNEYISNYTVCCSVSLLLPMYIIPSSLLLYWLANIAQVKKFILFFFLSTMNRQ